MTETDTKTLRILAVDDEALNLEIILHTLERNGYEVTGVTDGGKALVFLTTDPHKYDIVLLDRMMPIMGGMELLAKIKENPKFRNIPVIMQTAASSREEVAEGINAGAYYYLTKPYSKEALIKIVNTAANDVLNTRRKMALSGTEMPFVASTDRCSFDARTIEEAEITALYLANLFPDPDEVHFGIYELILNGIEHGNLEIGYQGKTSLNQQNAWREEVERRLKLPENANKKVHIDFEKKKDRILLTISDQGKGFAWEKYLTIDPTRATDDHGRGIAISNLRCFHTIEYIPPGNKVVCTVLLEESHNKTAKATSSAPAPQNEEPKGEW